MTETAQADRHECCDTARLAAHARNCPRRPENRDIPTEEDATDD